jgi:hypothetical protein
MFPAEFNPLIRDANVNYPNDPAKAAAHAEAESRKTPHFDNWNSALISEIFLHRVHEDRHQANTRIKKAAGEYTGPSKAGSLLDSPSCRKAHADNLFNLSFGGRRLGDMTREQVSDQISLEIQYETGHRHNRVFLSSIKGAMPASKPTLTVEVAVTDTNIISYWKRAIEAPQ